MINMLEFDPHLRQTQKVNGKDDDIDDEEAAAEEEEEMEEQMLLYDWDDWIQFDDV